MGGVVDGMGSAELSQPRRLLLRGRGGHDGSAGGDGELQGGYADAAAALDEDPGSGTGFAAAQTEEPVPGGEPGAGQGGGLQGCQGGGCVDEGGCREDDVRCEDAVVAVAEEVEEVRPARLGIVVVVVVVIDIGGG